MRTVAAAAGASLVLLACFASHDDSGAGAPRVRRGDFVSDLVLTGEMEAARGDDLTVPPLPSWQTSIKWIAEDGADVHKGEPVVELDSATLDSELDQKRQSATQAAQELQQSEAEWRADYEQKALDLDKKQSELEKAQLDAAVPLEIIAARKYEERQMRLQKATVELAKARDVLGAQSKGTGLDRANLLLKLERSEREIARAERALSQLVLRAPRDGLVVVRDIPWEGRKLQTGDPVWVGFPLALLPDLSSLQVTAALADVDDGRIAPGMRATIVLDAYPTKQYTARIERISSVAQEVGRGGQRRTFKVVALLDRIDLERMRPGLSARVIVRRVEKRNALLVPRSAIDFSGDAPRVRVASGRDVAVTLGPCNAQECVVMSGLEEKQELWSAAVPPLRTAGGCLENRVAQTLLSVSARETVASVFRRIPSGAHRQECLCHILRRSPVAAALRT